MRRKKLFRRWDLFFELELYPYPGERSRIILTTGSTRLDGNEESYHPTLAQARNIAITLMEMVEEAEEG
jgi:hypothetical protein